MLMRSCISLAVIVFTADFLERSCEISEGVGEVLVAKDRLKRRNMMENKVTKDN